MLELLFEFVGEFLLQVVGEALVQLGFHAAAEPFHRTPNPWFAALGYAIFGAALGGLSLLAFPTNFVPQPWRVLNLVVTPLAIGGILAARASFRAHRAKSVMGIDQFAYGYLFALSWALVRFFFAA